MKENRKRDSLPTVLYEAGLVHGVAAPDARLGTHSAGAAVVAVAGGDMTVGCWVLGVVFGEAQRAVRICHLVQTAEAAGVLSVHR